MNLGDEPKRKIVLPDPGALHSYVALDRRGGWVMLENNCQCELCRSVWGNPERKEQQAKLTRIEDKILASFMAPYPSVLILNSAKVAVEALYENH